MHCRCYHAYTWIVKLNQTITVCNHQTATTAFCSLHCTADCTYEFAPDTLYRETHTTHTQVARTLTLKALSRSGSIPGAGNFSSSSSSSSPSSSLTPSISSPSPLSEARVELCRHQRFTVITNQVS